MKKLLLTMLIFILGTTNIQTEEWNYDESIDPISDEKSIGFSYQSDNYRFAIACLSNSTAVMVQTQEYIGTTTSQYTDGIEIDYRIDKQTPKEALWLGDDRDTFVFSKKAITFLRELYKDGNQKLVMRIWGFDYDSILIELPLNDIKEPIDRVAKECNWNP